jgi:CBS domain-containing protein
MHTLPAALTAPVESVMSRRLVLVLEEIPMAEVRNIAAQYDYNGFPVVTQDGRLVGMITKGDLLRTARAAVAEPEVWAHPVSRWMAHGVLALRPADTVATAVEHLVDSGLRSLPVIDEDRRVIGIVSRNDLMTAIAQEPPAVTTGIERAES